MKNFNRKERREHKERGPEWDRLPACHPSLRSLRSLRLIISFAVGFYLCPAHAATVTGTIQNATGSGYAARLSFVPLSNPQVLTTNLLTGEVINRTCAANGTFTIVLQQGDYRVQIDNRDRFLISVPNNADTHQLVSLITQSLIWQYKFPFLPVNLNGYTNSITNLHTLSASNGVFSGSLRLPRFTLAQRDAYSPATNGLILLNTSDGTVNYYDGTNWITLGTGSGTVNITDFSSYFDTNSLITPTNLDNSRISASAAIDKSKISTNGTWALADIPALPESLITGLTADLAAKLNHIDDTATNLSLVGGTVTTTNLTWNTETLAPSGTTNFVLDFLSPRTALITATNDVNWLNSTNRTGSTGTERSKKVRVLASGANRTVTLHANWILIGSTSRTLTVTNGTWAVMALDNAGTSETNVFVGAIYAQ